MLAGGADAAGAAAAAAAAKAPFGEKWREDLAGDDKAALTDLAKYTDPKALYKSHRELQAKISRASSRRHRRRWRRMRRPNRRRSTARRTACPKRPRPMSKKLELPMAW